MMFESKPAGFESHWDSHWFKHKADECRRIAGLLSEQTSQQSLLLLAQDFEEQSKHAKLLASIAVPGRFMA
jgi:hypothetical protein